MVKSRISLIAAVLASAVIGGCASPVTREAVTPGRDITLPLPISSAEIEARTARLAGRLEQTRMGESERKVAMDLLNSYQMIGATLQPPMAEGDRQRIIRLLFESLSKIDEAYFLRESKEGDEFSRIIDQYTSRRKEIIQDYLDANHGMVVEKSIALRDLFGEEALTAEIGLLYSISLAKQGRLAEAVSSGESIVSELEKRPDLVNLRAYILEWQLAMGQDKSAEEGLKELTRRVAEKEALLKEARERMGFQEKAESSTETAPPIGPPLVYEDSSTPGSPESIETALAEVRDLVLRGEFTKAKFLLLQQRIRFPQGPQTEAIDAAMREVEVAQEKRELARDRGELLPEKSGDELRTEKAMLESERLILAKKLVEQENFAEAVARLDELQREGSASAEVASLKEMATEKLINKERNRAAKLYLMARAETDLSKKEELLVSSYNILKALLDKYPSSPLQKKVNDNMATIKDEMGRLKKRAQ
ncbi:MAG: hypothetical protein CVU64_11490 [Deltaproteobacteria bacterium HGW-Deltaproteobacteria-21]|nr:MAG: hypothetical protein CVU64_11490 [Deltaproteobacteria bacterium HGW-Deltaproteobacteria-21]